MCRSFSCLLLLRCRLYLLLHSVPSSSLLHLPLLPIIIIIWGPMKSVRRPLEALNQVCYLFCRSIRTMELRERHREGAGGLHRMSSSAAWIQPQSQDENTIKCAIFLCVFVASPLFSGPLLHSKAPPSAEGGRGGNKYDRNHLIIFIASPPPPRLLHGSPRLSSGGQRSEKESRGLARSRVITLSGRCTRPPQPLLPHPLLSR